MTEQNCIGVVIAGATGWVGQALVPAIIGDPTLELVGAVARNQAGSDAGEAVGGPHIGVTISDSVSAALHGLKSRRTDGTQSLVLVDYTGPLAVMGHVRAALAAGLHVVVGTSGLTPENLSEIERMANAHGRGAVIAGNFSLTAALMIKFAVIARAYIPDVEIVEMHSAGKPDAPSGTATETALKIGHAAQQPGAPMPRKRPPTVGMVEARGGEQAGVRVHSLRLPGFISHQEIIFGMPNELLTLRHDSFGASPYVAGTLLAVKKVIARPGLTYGLDTLLD